MQDATIHHGTATDACADGEVKAQALALPCSPAGFRKGCTVDVSVNRDRATKGVRKGLHKVGTAPTRLGGARDAAPIGRGLIKIKRAKGGNAKACVGNIMAAEPIQCRRNRLARIQCRDAVAVEDHAICVRQTKNKLGAARLNQPEMRSVHSASATTLARSPSR